MWDPDPTLRFLYIQMESSLGHPPPKIPWPKTGGVYEIPYPSGLVEVRTQVEEGLLIAYTIRNLERKDT